MRRNRGQALRVGIPRLLDHLQVGGAQRGLGEVWLAQRGDVGSPEAGHVAEELALRPGIVVDVALEEAEAIRAQLRELRRDRRTRAPVR